jgi:hypothetical protein
VPADLELVSNHTFNPVVVTHDLDLADNSLLVGGVAPLGEHLVVVPGDQQVGDSVASSDFNLAIVSSQDEAVCGLHHRHAHRVIRDVDGVVGRRLIRSLVVPWRHAPLATRVT